MVPLLRCGITTSVKSGSLVDLATPLVSSLSLFKYIFNHRVPIYLVFDPFFCLASCSLSYNATLPSFTTFSSLKLVRIRTNRISFRGYKKKRRWNWNTDKTTDLWNAWFDVCVLQIIIGKNSKFFFFTFSEVHVHIYSPNVTLASSSSFILNNMLHQLRLIFEIYFLYENLFYCTDQMI